MRLRSWVSPVATCAMAESISACLVVCMIPPFLFVYMFYLTQIKHPVNRKEGIGQ